MVVGIPFCIFLIEVCKGREKHIDGPCDQRNVVTDNAGSADDGGETNSIESFVNTSENSDISGSVVLAKSNLKNEDRDTNKEKCLKEKET